MNGVLADLKKAEYTISGAKFQFCISEIRLVGFICDFLKRYSDIFKIIKIVEWVLSNDITEARAFIKVMVYYCWSHRGDHRALKKRAKWSGLFYVLVARWVDRGG
jgi:hypothetical protein